MKEQTILIIQTAFLGDVIMSTPLVKGIRKAFPGAEIDILTIPETAVVFRSSPHIRQILTFNKRRSATKLFAFMKMVRQIRGNRYDIAFSLQGSFTSSLLMLLGGIPERVGFWRQKLITKKVRHERGLHMRHRYLALLRPFSDETFDDQTELFTDTRETGKARTIIQPLREKFRYLTGIAPGSVRPTKRWPEEYYVALTKYLMAHNIEPVFIGAPGERELCARIISSAAADAPNLAGQLSIPESAAVIRELDLMITNDSAPLHMSNAVGTDVFAFFGPTVRRFGCYPYRENDRILEVELYCRPCGKHGGKRCPEKHFRCMKEIRPESVQALITAHLEKQL